MSLFPSTINKYIYKFSSPVPDFPRRRYVGPYSGMFFDNLATLRQWNRFTASVNLLPAAAIIGGFFLYPTLTDRFKWRVGLPHNYTPTEEDLLE